MYTVALKKVVAYVADWVAPDRLTRLSNATGYYVQAWGLLPLSFSRVFLFLLISKWAPKFVKLDMYDL
jgi:hypothetical protein